MIATLLASVRVCVRRVPVVSLQLQTLAAVAVVVRAVVVRVVDLQNREMRYCAVRPEFYAFVAACLRVLS